MIALGLILAAALTSGPPSASAEVVSSSHAHALFSHPGTSGVGAVYLRRDRVLISGWSDEWVDHSFAPISVDGTVVDWSHVRLWPGEEPAFQVFVRGSWLVSAVESVEIQVGTSLTLRFAGEALDDLRFLFEYQESLDPLTPSH